MRKFNKSLTVLAGLLAALSAPAFGTVTAASIKPSTKSPAPIGKTITWTATGTDSGAGPLAFRFNVTPPGGTQMVVKDYLPGTLSGTTWTSPSFVWVPTGIEGTYVIEVVVKDFGTGLTASKSQNFTLDAVAKTGPVVEKTANPLVALFSTTSCAAGSKMRVSYEETTSTTPFYTNWVACHPPNTMTFEIAGMYPSGTYTMFAQTDTSGTFTKGSSVSFTTGALPTSIKFPKFSAVVSPSDTSNPVLLHNPITFGTAPVYPDIATDLTGNIIWYYSANDATNSDVLTRPLAGGGNLTIQDDLAWAGSVTQEQFLRQIDLAGNVVRETNMGAIQQELVALGSVDGGPCSAITPPARVGQGCAGSFHHDAIETLPNGWTAALIDIEKIFPAGTQGNTSGLPVDVIGDMIVVLDTNWQVQWYWDSFDPAGGGNGYPLLPVSNPPQSWAPTCGTSSAGCPPVFLLDSGFIAPFAIDWLHANSLYYWPAPQNGNTTGGDIIWSSRHQDLVFRIDYKDGAGTGNLLWRMGPPQVAPGTLTGNFSITNKWNDPYPWFSGQHDVGIQNGGSGVMTIFDNGDSRVAAISNCAPTYDCDSRGMAINFTEPTGDCATSCTPGVVTEVVSFDLGGYSVAMGSADLLSNGNYFFENPIVIDVKANATNGFSMEISPTNPSPHVGPADVLADVSGPEHYRGWQMPSLYDPPTT